MGLSSTDGLETPMMIGKPGEPAPAGHHRVDPVGGGYPGGLWCPERTGRTARRIQIDAHGLLAPAQRRGETVAPASACRSQAAWLHPGESGNGLDGFFSPGAYLICQFRVRILSPVCRLSCRPQ